MHIKCSEVGYNIEADHQEILQFIRQEKRNNFVKTGVLEKYKEIP